MEYLSKYEIPDFPKNSLLKNMYVFDFCSKTECNEMIESAELSAETHNGWRTKRHFRYPTTDIPLSYLDKNNNVCWEKWFDNKVSEKIIPILSQYYKCEFLSFHDLFIVKYGGSGSNKALQTELDIHRDASSCLLTCLITLNTGFQGGGTVVPALSKDNKKQILINPVGSISIHCSHLLHGGAKVFGDIPRYICVGFMKIDALWINRIAYTVPKDNLDDLTTLNRLELYEDLENNMINEIPNTTETYSIKDTKIKKSYLTLQPEIKWYYIEKFLSDKICERICKWAEDKIDYITLDTVDNKPLCETKIEPYKLTEICGNEMLPSILSFSKVKTRNIHMIIRKYSSDENCRDSLGEHYDCCEETIGITLNYKSDYKDGLFYYKFDDKKIIANAYNAGDISIHNKNMLHGVEPVTNGNRWTLIIFINHIKAGFATNEMKI